MLNSFTRVTWSVSINLCFSNKWKLWKKAARYLFISSIKDQEICMFEYVKVVTSRRFVKPSFWQFIWKPSHAICSVAYSCIKIRGNIIDNIFITERRRKLQYLFQVVTKMFFPYQNHVDNHHLYICCDSCEICVIESYQKISNLNFGAG